MRDDQADDRRHVAKIDPQRRPRHRADDAIDIASAGNPAHREWAEAALPAPDLEVIRAYRLERIRQQLRARDFAAAILYDPLNVRYATDVPNMQVWCLHNAVRYCFIATQGPVILFDFHGCRHLSKGFDLVSETRNATSWFYFGAGPGEHEQAHIWAAELADLVRAHGGGNKRVALDKCDQLGIEALRAQGLSPHSSQAFVEEARKIKHPEEIKAMRRAIYTSQVGMDAMWRALTPGVTENQLWAHLHKANIERGGEWIETRLLASGPRTNPWFQECSDRVIEAGDIVAFDTDLIGPYGYCSDISRTWITPGRRPSNAQIDLHALAREQIAHNTQALKPGMTFREFSDRSFPLPENYVANRYSVVLHGVGLCDEYPAVVYAQDYEKGGYDGVFEAGMCVCMESYIGEEGGREGVKLENQLLITPNGVERLDTYSMELIPV